MPHPDKRFAPITCIYSRPDRHLTIGPFSTYLGLITTAASAGALKSV